MSFRIPATTASMLLRMLLAASLRTIVRVIRVLFWHIQDCLVKPVTQEVQ